MGKGNGIGRGIAFLGALTIGAGGVFASPPDAPPPQDVSAQIAALQQQLNQLKAQQAEQQKLLEQKDQQTTATSVLNDARRKVNFLDLEDFTAGYENNRFVLKSADGNFVWRPWIHMQFRDVTLVREEFNSNGDTNTDDGFEMRRLRFGFDGNMFTPDLTYLFNWATVRGNGNATVKSSTGATVGTVSNNLGGTPLLEEAWVKYNFHNTPWYIKAGQIKDPLDHEQYLSSRYQQSAERSLSADIFCNGDAFLEGATLIYDPHDWFRTETGVTHGIRSANTTFLDYPNTYNSFDYGLAGRAEFKVFGDWKGYSQMSAVGVKDPYLIVGTGIDYSERGHAGQYVMVADATWAEPSGWFAYGSIIDRYTTHNFGIYTQSATGASIGTPDPAVADRPTNEYSLLAQIGYTIDSHWEPFGRYEYIKLQGTPVNSRNYIQDFTAGVNYYFYGHRAKLTAEMQYLPQGIPIDDGPNDLYTDNSHGEVMLVAQFQLLL